MLTDYYSAIFEAGNANKECQQLRGLTNRGLRERNETQAGCDRPFLRGVERNVQPFR